MAKATSKQVGSALCEALGLDPNMVRSIDLHVAVGEPATATAVEGQGEPPAAAPAAEWGAWEREQQAWA